MNRLLLVLGLSSVVGLAALASPQQTNGAEPMARDDVQDVVFLGEARPIFLRLHVRMAGKPVQAAADDFLQYLFTYLDVNGDGVLSKDEAARAPGVSLILDGLLGGRFGGFGAKGGPTAPSLADLDADQDGKVTRAELSAYYRKNGFVPIRFQADSGKPNPVQGFLRGGPPEPSLEAVSAAIFTLLDTDHDGKLSKAELAAAADVLLARDIDDDEIVTARELVPNVQLLTTDYFAGMRAMGGGGKTSPSTGNHQLMLITTPGEAPTNLVRHMQERYGQKGSSAEDVKLTRKALGLDGATFAVLDANGDGVLDARELTGFVKRRPDLELTVRLGKTKTGEARVEMSPQSGASPLAGKAAMKGSLLTLDLGRTRFDLQAGDMAGGLDLVGVFVRQQLQGQFKQADKDGNGYLDEHEATASRIFRPFFKAADRDGDGKLYEKEVLAYFDHLAELQRRAQASCVTLVLSDQSRGLFDLLDGNRDGRLSVREMRGAVTLLERLARADREFLSKIDIPRSYQLEVRPGAATSNANPAAAFAAMYMGSPKTERQGQATAGPAWFRKMDRNRDGDVSRKEFLFGDEVFRRIDLDGDGLISVQEAERYDALSRK